jgi:hypothetical protein
MGTGIRCNHRFRVTMDELKGGSDSKKKYDFKTVVLLCGTVSAHHKYYFSFGPLQVNIVAPPLCAT